MAEEELNNAAPAPAEAPETAEKKPVRRRVARKAADPADVPEAAAAPDAEAKPVRKRATRKKVEESEVAAEAAAEKLQSADLLSNSKNGGNISFITSGKKSVFECLGSTLLGFEIDGYVTEISPAEV